MTCYGCGPQGRGHDSEVCPDRGGAKAEDPMTDTRDGLSEERLTMLSSISTAYRATTWETTRMARELLALRQDHARLRAALRSERAVCLCGCPLEDHENYGEDGESCGLGAHECIRVAPAVRAAFAALVAGVERAYREWRAAEDRAVEAVERAEKAEQAIRKHLSDWYACGGFADIAEAFGVPSDNGMHRHALWKRVEKAEAERDAAREALREYGEHSRDCLQGQAHQGRPTKDGGYETLYGFGPAGRWYPRGEKPPCSCGLNAAIGEQP